MNIVAELSNDVAKEILMVLFFLDNKYIDKLCGEMLSRLSMMAADSSKNVVIMEGVPLLEQDISEECKDFISLLVYENSDAGRRDKLIAQWIVNEQRI